MSSASDLLKQPKDTFCDDELSAEVLFDELFLRHSIWLFLFRNSNSATITNNLEYILDMLTFLKVFWSCAFLLPGRVIKQVEQICKSFLWSGSWEKRVIRYSTGFLGYWMPGCLL
ncbi:hypothetical protein SLEP1_g44729 [Rubroshorea leprosula]|uniref:Maturase K n=1 Tax=Rubroshorea leprosula TaxID=152421 RepID=A0AAV5LH04_9ROSI|nr:hypothetical protein SLEP1_g44729 [Rubroshorea leprosula]